jgi:RimJ/RimL family protein N-acetyltransferase
VAIKALVRSLMRSILADYRINWIVASPALSKPATTASVASGIHSVNDDIAAQMASSPTLQVRKALAYQRAGLLGYALVVDGAIVSVAHFSDHDHYDRSDTWPLLQGEMALMDIVTEDAARGRGYAVPLIAQATSALLSQGCSRLIAFIWWSNTPSHRSFSKAGWRRIGLSIEIKIGTRWLALRVPIQSFRT